MQLQTAMKVVLLATQLVKAQTIRLSTISCTSWCLQAPAVLHNCELTSGLAISGMSQFLQAGAFEMKHIAVISWSFLWYKKQASLILSRLLRQHHLQVVGLLGCSMITAKTVTLQHPTGLHASTPVLCSWCFKCWHDAILTYVILLHGIFKVCP